MSVEVRKIPSKYERMTLEVVQAGLQVTVKAGAFTAGQSEFELLEDMTFTVEPDNDNPLEVRGHLARHRTSKQVVIAVDEFFRSREDGPARWDGDYEALMFVYRMLVPPKVTTLDDVQIIVDHCVAVEKGA
jgi:hypothetical protein